MEKPNSIVVWGDFFNDGDSELLEWFTNTEGKATFKLTSQTGYIIDVHTFEGQTLNYRNPPVIVDLDRNGFDEIWSFFHRNDSLFFNKVCYDQDSVKYAGEEIFVSKVANPSGSLDYDINFNYTLLEKYDDGTFVFCVNAGYPLQPRHVYRYFPAGNFLVQSAYMGAATGLNDISDLNGDSCKEYLLGQYAPGNLEDSLIEGLNDQFVRLLVLDDSLWTLWDSERFDGIFSSITTQTFRNDKDENFIAALIGNNKNPSSGDKLVVYSKDLRKIAEKEIPGTGTKISHIILPTVQNIPGFSLYGSDGSVTTYSVDLKVINKKKLPVPGHIYRILDIDKDGEKEIVINNMGDISVLRSDFSQTVTIRTNVESPVQTLCSLKKNKNKSNELCILTKSSFQLIAYSRNNWFHLRFPAVLVYWFALYFLVFVIQYLQKLAFRDKYLTERKMSEMQLLLIRNQLSPHFLFNAINSVSYRLMEKNPEEANNSVIRLSRLIRSNLMASDRFSRSLREELDASTAYAEIVRAQMEEPFELSVNVNPETSMDIQVPVMVIQNYLENAIKHGVRSMGKRGKITITALGDGKSINIRITDNGIGRKQSEESGQEIPSTGKGMVLMMRIFDEVNKANDRKISVKVVDLTDDLGNPAGTEVSIDIPINLKYRLYES